MGRVLDGVADHFEGYAEDRRFLVSDQKEASHEGVVAELRDAKVDGLVNFSRSARNARRGSTPSARSRRASRS